MKTALLKQTPEDILLREKGEIEFCIREHAFWKAKFEKKLARVVEKLKAVCQHKFRPVKGQEKHLIVDSLECYLYLYLGEECEKCGDFRPRAEGRAWQVCYNCGTKDISTSHVRTVDEGEIRGYKCASCGFGFELLFKDRGKSKRKETQ